MNNIHIKNDMGTTEGEVKALEELSQITIIDLDSPQIQECIKKQKEVSDYALRILQILPKEKVSLSPSPDVANLIPIISATADERLGFPFSKKLLVVCCPDCIENLESKLHFKRNVLNVAPCGYTTFSKGDICPFCGKLYVGSFCDSITDYLAFYGYNRRFTKKKPLEMLKKASKKKKFYFWKMNQFPGSIFINNCFFRQQEVECAIKNLL